MSDPLYAANSRLLEAELVRLAKKEGFEIAKDAFRNSIIPNCQGYDLNLADVARKLTEQGVKISIRGAKVK